MPTIDRVRWVAVGAALAVAAPAAFGQPFGWDPAGGPSGPQGGAGAWTAAGVSWWDGTTGANVVLPADGTANFGGTAGAVQVVGDVSARGLGFSTTGYALFPALNGGRVNLSGSVPTLFADPGVAAQVGVELAGSGTLRKGGSGTISLTAAATFTGTLQVNAGAVQVQQSTPVGLAVEVNLGTLGGGGTVNGPVTVTSNGVLSPGGIGASPTVDTLTVGATAWQSGGAFRVEVQDADAAAGAGYDRLLGTSGSALAITGTPASPFTVRLASLTPGVSGPPTPGPARDFVNTQSYAWTVATFGGGITGFSAANVVLDSTGFLNDLGGGTFALAQSGNSLVVTFTPVPEPATALGLSAAGLAAAGWGRRRRAVVTSSAVGRPTSGL